MQFTPQQLVGGHKYIEAVKYVFWIMVFDFSGLATGWKTGAYKIPN